MHKQSVPPLLHPSQIRRSIRVARKNWKAWRDVFEHRSTIATNPLLSDAKRFASFCKEYSVARTIRRGRQDEFRRSLIGSLPEVVRDDSGRALVRLEEELRRRFGAKSRARTHGGPNRIVSVLSKVAAFVRPDQFVAWDTYGKKGVKRVLGRTQEFQSYAEYLDAFDQVWNGQWGQQIRYLVATVPARSSFEREPRFLRRVLDVCLMKHGGRKGL